MNPYLRAPLACFAVLAAVVALALAGCADAPGISSYPEWRTEYDADYSAALACVQRDLGVTTVLKRPYIEVRGDCWVNSQGVQIFATRHSYTGYATGMTHIPWIEVCPDLKALRHESTHYVYGMLAGDYMANGSGRCGL